VNISEIVSIVLAFVGTLFFVSGTVGLIRLPDIYTRLHALTKADNLGLGLIVIAVIVNSPSWLLAAKLILVWLLVITTSACVGYLIARGAKVKGIKPWKR